jgi:hypothetical protein
MNNGEDISITLSPVQVEQVMRSAGRSQAGTVSSLLLAALDNAHQSSNGGGKKASNRLQQASQEALSAALTDPQLSQSLLRGLSILSCYGPERPWRPIIDLAQQLGMSPSTTHRYVKTLRAVGLLEQNPSTREYRPVAM